MKYQLVIQWVATSVKDYDAMISVEDALIEGLADDCEIDGHDGGSGQVNIFLLTDNPTKTFEEVKKVLEDCGAWSEFRIAYRERQADKYTILWPQSLAKFEII